jgi:hypothetical protein
MMGGGFNGRSQRPLEERGRGKEEERETLRWPVDIDIAIYYGAIRRSNYLDICAAANARYSMIV